MRRAVSLALLSTTALAALLGCSSLDRATDVATGYVSHQLCSATFVTRVEPEQFYREAIAPILSPAGFLSSHRVDRERAQVTSDFAGVAEARALDRAFAENASPPYRNTKAVVIVRDGRVIADRYALGYGIDTQMMGWSATKSVTNALIGILVRQGKVALDGPAPIAAWSDLRDPRHAISIDNLLRMNSGLDIGESMTARATTAFDPSAYMVFGV